MSTKKTDGRRVHTDAGCTRCKWPRKGPRGQCGCNVSDNARVAAGRSAALKQRASLAPPRVLDTAYLQKVAEEISVTKTRTDLNEQDRSDMESLLTAFGERLPSGYNTNPHFITNVLLHSLRRRGIETAKADAVKQQTQREREQQAIEKMKSESAAAWRTKK
jgi:hypothetical protein